MTQAAPKPYRKCCVEMMIGAAARARNGEGSPDIDRRRHSWSLVMAAGAVRHRLALNGEKEEERCEPKMPGMAPRSGVKP